MDLYLHRCLAALSCPRGDSRRLPGSTGYRGHPLQMAQAANTGGICSTVSDGTHSARIGPCVQVRVCLHLDFKEWIHHRAIGQSHLHDPSWGEQWRQNCFLEELKACHSNSEAGLYPSVSTGQSTKSKKFILKR